MRPENSVSKAMKSALLIELVIKGKHSKKLAAVMFILSFIYGGPEVFYIIKNRLFINKLL